MLKKILRLLFVSVLLIALFACKSSEPANLEGEWKQTNNNSEDSWQAATIDGQTITIYWVSDNGDSKALYWAGSFIAPSTTDEPYSWDSKNDFSKTDSAMLASGDETKTMAYEKGEISYSVSALGITTTVRLKKQN